MVNAHSRQDSQVPRGAARVEPIFCLPDIVRECGGNADEIFANAGVPISILESADNCVSYFEFGRLLAAASAATHCAHVGLLVGARGGLSRLGPVGLFAANASDVGAALSDIVERMPSFDRAATVSLDESGDAATFRCDLFEPNIPGAELIRETIVAVMARVLRELCGPSWKPDLVAFSHKARGPTEPYVKFFRAAVVFNSAWAGLVFSRRVLRQPVSLASQAVRSALKQQLDRLDAGVSDTFSDRVRRQIHIAMGRGQFSESAIARSLDVNTSTLRRKLAREGTKFGTVVQGAKFGVAAQLIDDTDLTFADVASAIGIYDSSVFTHAFRRWSGLTPSQWRKRKKGSW